MRITRSDANERSRRARLKDEIGLDNLQRLQLIIVHLHVPPATVPLTLGAPIALHDLASLRVHDLREPDPIGLGLYTRPGR